MNKPKLSMSLIAKRRRQLLDCIGDSLLVLPSATEKIRNRDCLFRFRQDSDFWYLSHFNEPEAIMVLDGKNKTSILFSKPYDAHYAIWEGEIVGQERAVSDFLFDESYSIDDFQAYMEASCDSFATIISPFGRYRDFDCSLLDTIEKPRNKRRSKVIQNWLHSDQFIHKMRQVKDKFEVSMMRYAAVVSATAHTQVIKQVTSLNHESQIEALLNYNYTSAGGVAAYQNIVAGGNNACILHYTENKNSLDSNDLVLIDSGCEIDGYAADITRTIPVNGQFTPVQKRVYHHVLEAQELAIKSIKPGVNINKPHEVARNRLIEGMIDLKLLSGSLESILKDKSYTKYFMHGTSHWLGIDVHDVGDYVDEEGKSMLLKENMVITVEPGIYIRADDQDAPEALRGIGIRIEDDILVTKEGYENLTAQSPKSIEEIENLAKK